MVDTAPAPIALVGPTASGKSALALAVARARPRVELVSVDSMQVYRGMDIGTAKPSASERAEVPHHGLDLADPHQEFTVAEFQAAIRAALGTVENRGARPLLVGGTGLYLRSIVDDLEVPGRYPQVAARLESEPDTAQLHNQLQALDPLAAAKMEPSNRRRVIRALEVTLGSGRPFSSFGPGLDAYPPTRFVMVGIQLPRPTIDERIIARYHAQMEAGFLDEVRQLWSDPAGMSRTARQALGYKELIEHLEGRLSLQEALELAIVRTRQFARRQERWFRRDPRIRWIGSRDEEVDADQLREELLAIWDQR